MVKNSYAQSKSQHTLTVVIPTYTGVDTIPNAFKSILAQESSIRYEVIVVIDGPNQQLRSVVAKYQEIFHSHGVRLRIHQFDSNQGVFQAVLKGVEIASTKKVALVSDRMELSADYFSILTKSNEEIVIPNILEKKANNPVSHTLYLIRKKVYGKRSQRSYHISAKNFEKSEKGTGGLYIDRKLFIAASNSVLSAGIDAQNVSDDTKLFKELIDQGKSIYKNANLKAYYFPRELLWEELIHVYKRGPKFVDYYIHPKTRYFLPLILTIFVSVITAILLIVKLSVLFLLFIILYLTIISSLYLSEKPIDILKLLWTVPLIAGTFYLGIIRGLIIYFTDAKTNKIS